MGSVLGERRAGRKGEPRARERGQLARECEGREEGTKQSKVTVLPLGEEEGRKRREREERGGGTEERKMQGGTA